jgi:hypothetical protein
VRLLRVTRAACGEHEAARDVSRSKPRGVSGQPEGVCPHERGEGDGWTPRKICFKIPLRTDAIEKALYLRQWGVPFDALAYVFGRDVMVWYHARLAFGRPSLVGTTVKEPQKLPRDLVADERLTRVAKQQVYVPTTVGRGCFLGVNVVEAVDTVTLQKGYGELDKEAKAFDPAYQARSVCTDGWEATHQAWRGLFPKIKLVLCFLHSILKIKKHCVGQLRHQGIDRAWQVY